MADASPIDDELVRCMIAYQAGELAAFERLHTLVAGEVERFFVGLQRDRSVAQDLTQETFLELHRARRTYRPPLPVRPWVFGIARNVERRHRRFVARRGTVPLDELETRDEAPATASGVGAAIARRDLQSALRELPPARRTAWLLHHVHGWSFGEIGARLGIGTTAAKLRSSRATGSLRAILANQEKSDDDGE